MADCGRNALAQCELAVTCVRPMPGRNPGPDPPSDGIPLTSSDTERTLNVARVRDEAATAQSESSCHDSLANLSAAHGPPAAARLTQPPPLLLPPLRPLLPPLLLPTKEHVGARFTGQRGGPVAPAAGTAASRAALVPAAAAAPPDSVGADAAPCLLQLAASCNRGQLPLQLRPAQARPAHNVFCVSVFAARALNTTGASRVTRSPQ